MCLRPSPAAARPSPTARILCRFAALLLSVLGVGLAMPALAAPAASNRWTDLRQGDARVATVMYRLAVANRRFCRDSLAPQPGLALHSLAQYDPAERAAAAQAFRLGRHVGVMAVAADSPAAHAGLRADDQLISVDGRALPDVDGLGSASDASVEAARQMLMAAMQSGEVALLVTGPDGDRVVRFTAEQGCRSTAEFDPGAAVNASADGQRVMVGAGLLARCTDGGDNDLALVIAHELAHNLLHHAARLAQIGVVTGVPHGAAADATIEATEEEADALGVHLAMAAGYDLGGSAAFMGSLQAGAGFDRLPATYPAPARRLALLAAAIADGQKRPGSYGLIGQLAALPNTGPRYR